MGPRPSTGSQRGIVLLGLLVFILITCLAASTLVVSWQTQLRREKEAELLFVGDQFRRAIQSYYNTTPAGSPRSLPPSLEALVDDQRFPTPRQHLRRIYVDPMTGNVDWELVRESNGIVGVHSRSEARPLKIAGFSAQYRTFEGTRTYSQWKFQIETARGP